LIGGYVEGQPSNVARGKELGERFEGLASGSGESGKRADVGGEPSSECGCLRDVLLRGRQCSPNGIVERVSGHKKLYRSECGGTIRIVRIKLFAVAMRRQKKSASRSSDWQRVVLNVRVL
jgi:hypothetical protein